MRMVVISCMRMMIISCFRYDVTKLCEYILVVFSFLTLFGKLRNQCEDSFCMLDFAPAQRRILTVPWISFCLAYPPHQQQIALRPLLNALGANKIFQILNCNSNNSKKYFFEDIILAWNTKIRIIFRRCSTKHGFLRNFAIFSGKSLQLDKKRDTNIRVLPANFAKFLITHFKEHFRVTASEYLKLIQLKKHWPDFFEISQLKKYKNCLKSTL